MGKKKFRVQKYIKDDDRILETDFLITINSNIFPGSLNELEDLEVSTQLLIEQDLGTREGINDVIEFLEDGKILESDTNYVTEIGINNKGRRYHVHIYIKFKHFGKIRFDLKKLKEKVISYWSSNNIYNPYINVKIVKEEKNILDYIDPEIYFNKIKR